MNPAPLKYEIIQKCRSTHARLGRVTTLHGEFETPVFMPVGTRGTIKGLLPQLVKDAGSTIILNNAYHLMLRPSAELIQSAGRRARIHEMGWPDPHRFRWVSGILHGRHQSNFRRWRHLQVHH